MSPFELLLIISHVALAIAALWIAVSLHKLSAGVTPLTKLETSVNRMVHAVERFKFRNDDYTPHPHHEPHHHFFGLVRNQIIVWEWCDGQWVLRNDGLTPEQAGSKPDRKGEFDGECVTMQKPK